MQIHKLQVLVTLFLLLASSGCSPSPSSVSLPRTYKVGYREITFVDSRRARQLDVMMWYPAHPATVERELAYQQFALGRAAQDAAYIGGRRPLILFSHGNRGSNVDQAWLAEYLASQGYIIASVAHWLNTNRNNRPEATLAMWERPQDLSFVLTALLRDSTWAARIDAARIGAAGHSSGGYTVLALAGAVYKSELMGTYCKGPLRAADCTLVDGADLAKVDRSGDGRLYRDERVRAVFAMAPAVGQGIEVASLKQIHIPVQIVAAADDSLLRPALNADRYAQFIPNVVSTRLPAGGHFVFMSPCAFGARAFTYFSSFDVCGRRDGERRPAVRDQVAQLALRFFNRSLTLPATTSVGSSQRNADSPTFVDPAP